MAVKDKINKLKYLKNFAEEQVSGYIMPFWRSYSKDKENGGFYGRIENDLTIDKTADKGVVLNARMLWTFSISYLKFDVKKDLELADRAYDYIMNNFCDSKYGGYFWSLKYDGSPLVKKKQVYAQAFMIYGLCEYYKVNGKQEVLNKAINIFHLIEDYAFDKKNNGYIEACDRDWKETNDLKLSKNDLNEKKGMNTHLHILEAYTNLYRVWKDTVLKEKLENLIILFIEKIIDREDNHLILFFDELWNPKSSLISFGHDIESSWLLHEAALITGNNKLIQRTINKILKMTMAVLEGYHSNGAILYEDDRKGLHKDNELEWWVQAEAIVGFLNSYSLKNDPVFLDTAYKISCFIDKYFGEWYFRIDINGRPNDTYEKAGFWKCPYHNTRACIEILNRCDKIIGKAVK